MNKKNKDSVFITLTKAMVIQTFSLFCQDKIIPQNADALWLHDF